MWYQTVKISVDWLRYVQSEVAESHRHRLATAIHITQLQEAVSYTHLTLPTIYSV